MNIAQTILQQLGGHKFIAMTGAKDFISDKNALIFRIGTGAINKANKVIIKLEPNDTYTMTFFRIRKFEAKIVGEDAFIYAEDLQKTFTQNTGFDTHL